ncbi:MAG: hypothetical protein SF187_00065 [Deltaproteobacteria bacterium]|nr:hypothetical protein [Deltaproteobacteria bacterium]
MSVGAAKPPAQADWFAVANPGLAGPVAKEWAALLPNVTLSTTDAGVEFVTSATQVRAALPWLRATTRLWRRLCTTKARAFGELERKWSAVSWADFVPAGHQLRVDVTIRHCRLYHSGAIKERLAAAVAGHVILGTTTLAPEARLLVRGENDEFQVSVDASGERLNVRGYRQEVGRAPLRETLAAGLLSLCGWRPGEALVDPMCGSGTIGIEAMLAAWGVPSGDRAFAMDAWPCFAAEVPREPPQRGLPETPQLVLVADKDAVMVERARRNATRAGVAHGMRFLAQGFETLAPPSASGLLLFNPPYGHRLGAAAGMTKQFTGMARTLATSWRSWRGGVLLPKGAELRAAGLKLQQQWPLSNGGLPVVLSLYNID